MSRLVVEKLFDEYAELDYEDEESTSQCMRESLCRNSNKIEYHNLPYKE